MPSQFHFKIAINTCEIQYAVNTHIYQYVFVQSCTIGIEVEHFSVEW